MSGESITVPEANNYATDDKRYSFVSLLGQGSFGTVLKARDDRENEDVAIKIVKARKSIMAIILRRKSSTLDDAKQEVDMLIQLQHQNIVSLKAFYEFKEKRGIIGLAMVMEFCGKGNLQTYLETAASAGERPDIPLRMHWYKQLSIGLNFIHTKGIVHRDLKPPNILLDYDNNIKIADVGLAKTVWDVKSQCNELPEDTTFHRYMSTITGTPAYMAPEVWEEHYQMTSDVFSLGLIFIMIAEVPSRPIPLAQWASNEDCVGVIMYKYPPSDDLIPTHILHPPLQHSVVSEVKLYDDMLQHDFHKRPSMEEVVQRVEEIGKEYERKRTISSDTAVTAPDNSTDTATERRGWCST